MKKYRLLKDLPGIKAGDIFELVDSTNTSRLNDYYECCGIFADCGVVEDNPDWFEEIQDKEFTRDDMIFCTKAACGLGHVVADSIIVDTLEAACHFHKDIVKFVDEWIKERK